MNIRQDFVISVTKEEDGYIAVCQQNHVSSQGDTVEEALINIGKALQLFLEDCNESEQTFVLRTEAVLYKIDEGYGIKMTGKQFLELIKEW